MYLDVDLNIISDDDVELNLYPIMRILENQRVRNQNDENLLEAEKQEVISCNLFSIWFINTIGFLLRISLF